MFIVLASLVLYVLRPMYRSFISSLGMLYITAHFIFIIL